MVFPGFEQSRCLRWDETAFFPGFCAVSVLEKGRDCGFSGVLCGLGAGEGTRLLFFRDFARSRCLGWGETVVFPGFEQSRCLRWDETAVFLGFCAVSVSEKGRDCRCRVKCVPRLVGGSLIVRLSVKTASQSCCCIRGVGSGGTGCWSFRKGQRPWNARR